MLISAENSPNEKMPDHEPIFMKSNYLIKKYSSSNNGQENNNSIKSANNFHYKNTDQLNNDPKEYLCNKDKICKKKFLKNKNSNNGNDPSPDRNINKKLSSIHTVGIGGFSQLNQPQQTSQTVDKFQK